MYAIVWMDLNRYWKRIINYHALTYRKDAFILFRTFFIGLRFNKDIKKHELSFILIKSPIHKNHLYGIIFFIILDQYKYILCSSLFYYIHALFYSIQPI